MKDVTLGAAREIAGGKAGMDDNSESGMLSFFPSNKGESLSSLFCIQVRKQVTEKLFTTK